MKRILANLGFSTVLIVALAAHAMVSYPLHPVTVCVLAFVACVVVVLLCIAKHFDEPRHERDEREIHRAMARNMED